MNKPNSTSRDNMIPTRTTYTKEEGQFLSDAYRSVPNAGYLALDPNSKDGKLPLGRKPDTIVPGRNHTSTDATVTVDELPDYVSSGYGLGIVAGYDADKDQHLVVVDADNWEDTTAFDAWYRARDPEQKRPIMSVYTPGRTASRTHSGGAHFYLVVDAADWPDTGDTATLTEHSVGAANAVLGEVRLGWGAKLGRSYACMPSTQRVVNGQWRDYRLNLDDDGRVQVTKAYKGFVQDLIYYSKNPPTGKVDTLGTITTPNWGEYSVPTDNDAVAILRRLVSGEVTRDDAISPAFYNATQALVEVVWYNRQVQRWTWGT